MTAVQIELERDEEARAELAALGAEVVVEPENFDGGLPILSAVVALSSVVIPHITAIVKARIAGSRYVKVKIKGIEISGADLSDIGKFLESQKDKD